MAKEKQPSDRTMWNMTKRAYGVPGGDMPEISADTRRAKLMREHIERMRERYLEMDHNIELLLLEFFRWGEPQCGRPGGFANRRQLMDVVADRRKEQAEFEESLERKERFLSIYLTRVANGDPLLTPEDRGEYLFGF